MKIALPLIAAVIIAFVSTAAMADSLAERQAEQQACENDVYTYCSEAIPDEDRIATCLRKNWRKISRACRTVMNEHGSKHGARKHR